MRKSRLATAEIYDPVTNSWRAGGSLTGARGVHTATLLPTGEVLVAGGLDEGTQKAVATAELFDPAAGSWTTTGPLVHARLLHTATLLQAGGVLAVAGYGTQADLTPIPFAEVYDNIDCATVAAGTPCGLCQACAPDGTCAPVADETLCDLDDPCVTGSVCRAGTCGHGTPLVCHDYCHLVSCVAGVGCPPEHPCDERRDAANRDITDWPGWDSQGGEPPDRPPGGPNCMCRQAGADRAPAWLALAVLAIWVRRRRAGRPPAVACPVSGKILALFKMPRLRPTPVR